MIGGPVIIIPLVITAGLIISEIRSYMRHRQLPKETEKFWSS
jgi:hypothetical protein